LKTHIQGVQPFKAAISKIGEIGTLLECYYEIHSNTSYGEAILYSFSFYGYITNLWNLFENIQRKRIGIASFRDASNNLVIKDQYYPALLDENYVTNDVVIGKNMVVTGPNAAGKTTYLKTAMLNIIFSQQVGCGFYSGCQMKPYTHIHSYLNIPDTSGRDSLFQAESRRCKEIIDEVLKTDANPRSRHFCIFDELYSGTNPGEATKSAYAFLVWLAERGNVDFILTTHYTDMCSKIKKSPAARICNWKMDAKESVGGENIEYTYKIVKGVSKIQGAIKVLRAMNYPQEIIDNILQFDVANPAK
jgi:DNA mismatch repair protein MutS